MSELRLPANVPDVWGEGQIFGFSGLDGPTETAGGFVATTADERYGLLIHTPRKRLLRVAAPEAGKVLAATGDVLAVELPAGMLVLTWGAWHTLVGCVPDGVTVALGLVDGGGEPADAVELEVRDGRLALAYGATADEARARCDAGLEVDAIATAGGRLRYMDGLPAVGDPQRDRLLRKCASVMKVNTLAPEGAMGRLWSTPDRVPHKHMWLWDSVFHSMARSLLDPAASLELLRAMLDSIWTEAEAAEAGHPDWAGMCSHMVQVNGSRSHVTQPPILAWGVHEAVSRLPDRRAPAEVLAQLERYLEWDLAHRQPRGNGLLQWWIEGDPRCRCGESGLDNSTRFDADAELDAVDFSVLAAHDMERLAALFDLAGEEDKAGAWRERAAATEAAIHELLWDEADGFYYDRTADGRLTGVKAVSGFFPLLLASTPAERVDRLIDMLGSEHFATPHPIATIARTDPTFGTDMWRGPMWLNTNWFVIEGLKRHGRREAAEALTKRSLALVARHYARAGVLFEFYDTLDQTPPERCERKGPPDDAPYLLGKVNAIRDYHWTAAVTFRLLAGASV